jgi:pimeloyl-ACP methyl ester carboxylesterase
MSPLLFPSSSVVLVHGAWVGPRCWDPVVAELSHAGVQPYVVTLKGSGERRTENGPDITLDDHIDDVVAVINEHELHNVTLVGHSYGGRVITGVIATIPDRISHAIFVDAHAPVTHDDGPTDERRAQAAANGGMLPFSGFRFDADLVGDDTLYEVLMRDVVDHPFGTLTSSWQHELSPKAKKTYVRALGPDAAPFEKYAVACRSDDDWSYIELDGPHMLQFTHPRELATIITGGN